MLVLGGGVAGGLGMFEYLQFKNIVFFGTNVHVEIWVEDDKVHYTKRLWRPGNINVTDVSSLSVKDVSG